METLYRKVAVSEKHPKEDGFYYVFNGLKHSTYYSKLLGFNYCMGQINMSNKITHYLEEIPDNTTQLQADKAELLEALEKVKRLEPIICMGGAVAEQWQNEAQALNEMMSGIESLIQKHKQ